MDISLNSNVRIVAKDEILFREGEAANKIFLIKSGAILCLKKSKDRLVPVYSATNQNVIGEEAVLTRTGYSYTAVVSESAQVVEVDAKLVTKTLDEAPYWLGALMATLGERFNGTADAVSEHRIFAPELAGDQELSAQEETRLKKLINQ